MSYKNSNNGPRFQRSNNNSLSLGNGERFRRFREVIAEASTRLGKVLHSTFLMGEGNREYGVWVFFDFENTIHLLGEGYDLKSLKGRIEAVLKKFGDYFVIGIIGYGNLKAFSPEEFCFLQDQGFELFHIERRFDQCDSCQPINQGGDPYERKTDQADKLIIQSMCLYALDVKAPANIQVISGDADFATPIATLKSRGFTMFVAAHKDSNPLLLESGNVMWYWSEVCSST